jgi:pectate lyase
MLGTLRSRWLASLGAVTAVVGAAVVVPAVTSTAASAATIDTSAQYVLVNRHSGKAMDVYNLATNDGAPIMQFSRNDGAWQQWQFVDAGSGYYKLKSNHSGKVLELPDSNDGTQLVQKTDNGSSRQHFQVKDSDSGYIRLVNRSSGKALDVWEWLTTDGSKIAQFQDLDGWNQQWQLVKMGGGGNPNPPSGLEGWATQNGGTSGGGSAGAVNVTSASALTSAASGTGSAVIRVTSSFSCSGMLRIGSNKTIIGNSGATITGCGLTLSGSRNVIIQNLSFRNWDDDAINIESGSTNIWVDHNSFTNGYDGAVDVKRGSDFITISWNRVYGHDKSMLLGHSDDNASQDRGKLRVTYHHNYFDGSGTRHPRVRFGNPVHVYNNYYRNNEYGVASTMDGGVLVEGNYFEGVDEPTLVGYASSDPGTLVQRNNVFVSSGSPESAGSVNSIPYSYNLQSAANAKSSVQSGAGAR